MRHIKRNVSLAGRIGAAFLTAAVSLLTFGSPASAAGCVYTPPAYGGSAWEYSANGHTGTYYYTLRMTVPHSPCNDINIASINSAYAPGYCGQFRVRFYPHSGGNYANNWKYLCSSWNGNLQPAATWVSEGTSFRIEYYNARSFLVVD